MRKKQKIRFCKQAEWLNKGVTPDIVFDKIKLKPLQKAILNCLQFSDIIANLPTGFGKSLLFQYPASQIINNQQCVVVIVPLKALLWDTVREANGLGIKAASVDSTIIRQYYFNDKLPQLLVMTPEKLVKNQAVFQFIESLNTYNKIRLLAIDQCHCISQWGHDFRPAYLQICKIIQTLTSNKVKLLAISATVDRQTLNDLATRLSLVEACYFQASYNRPNLYYDILPVPQIRQTQKLYKTACQTIVSYLNSKQLFLKEPGIIYCQTISASEQLTKMLKDYVGKQEAHKIGVFNSKQSENARNLTYTNFMKADVHKLIVATICFGMGINKNNLRYVIHLGMSKSSANYYQESGRAGRDGQKAYCLLLNFQGSRGYRSLQFLINNGKSNKKLKNYQFKQLEQMKAYSSNQLHCRRTKLFEYLGQIFHKQDCNDHCDICGRAQNLVTEQLNFTNQCLQIIQKLFEDNGIQFTKKQYCGYLKGKNIKQKRRNKQITLEFGKQIHGIFKKYEPDLIERIFEELLVGKGVLTMKIKQMKSGYSIKYYQLARQYKKDRNSKFILTRVLNKQNKQTGVKINRQGRSFDKFDKYLKGKSSSDNISKPNEQTKKKDTKKDNQIELLKEAELFKPEKIPLSYSGDEDQQKIEAQQSFQQIMEEDDYNFLSELLKEELEDKPLQLLDEKQSEQVIEIDRDTLLKSQQKKNYSKLFLQKADDKQRTNRPIKNLKRDTGSRDFL